MVYSFMENGKVIQKNTAAFFRKNYRKNDVIDILLILKGKNSFTSPQTGDLLSAQDSFYTIEILDIRDLTNSTLTLNSQSPHSTAIRPANLSILELLPI